MCSLEVTEGEAACFTVGVSGRPSPRVSWQHNGNAVVEGGSPYFEVLHSPDGMHHSLRIGEVFADDAGTVSVTAENEAGAVSASASLAVKRLCHCLLHSPTCLSPTVPRVLALSRPRHQGGAHGGRAPAKIVRAPAK